MTTNTGGLPERIADVARLRDAGLFDASRALSLLLLAEHPDELWLDGAWHERS